MPTDLELLEIEIDTQWTQDRRGRLLESRNAAGWAAPLLVVGTAEEGHAVAIASDVPDALAAELQAAIADSSSSPDPATRPAGLDRCERLLRDALGPVALASGPSYIVPPSTAFEPSTRIVRSDGYGAESLRGMNPERGGWSAEEWAQLLDGELGPWATAVEDEKVVSLCHSARLTESGAEAGTWTDPAYRGQGHAAACTAAWASLFPPGGPHLYYSTSADNRSSQRVAARLGLPLIGWMWQLTRAR